MACITCPQAGVESCCGATTQGGGCFLVSFGCLQRLAPNDHVVFEVLDSEPTADDVGRAQAAAAAAAASGGPAAAAPAVAAVLGSSSSSGPRMQPDEREHVLLYLFK